VKIEGNEKYEFYSIQLQCHSTFHSTQPNPTQPMDGPNPCPSLGEIISRLKPWHIAVDDVRLLSPAYTRRNRLDNRLCRVKIQSFINKSKRNGYCSPGLPDFNNLCTSMKVDLFNKVLKIPIHVLHSLLPPSVSYTQRYGLRPRVHDRTLPGRT